MMFAYALAVYRLSYPIDLLRGFVSRSAVAVIVTEQTTEVEFCFVTKRLYVELKVSTNYFILNKV